MPYPQMVECPGNWRIDATDFEASNFHALLFRLIRKADGANKERLRLAFPVEVAYIEVYRNTGKFPDRVRINDPFRSQVTRDLEIPS